ncbi:MAG: fibronectin type III domain-containing protein [Bacteroidota bacterium]|nr:fibronectin type III domain-containing protein [Bacteroidota bacterium]
MKNKNLLVFAIYFVAIFFTHKLFSQALYPYLQTIKPNSVYVTWKTSSNSQSLLEYGLSSSALTSSVNGFNQIWTDAGYSNNYYYHTVKLNGLTPNTKYYYRITTGSQQSAVYSFKTLPLPGNAATAGGKIRFLLMGDNQIKSQPRFDSLVSAAKRKIKQKWGGDPSDHIALNFMVGDQVDVGTLDHYEWVHFDKNKLLSPYIPIQTTVGNHELYGTLGINSYYNHFYLDTLPYQGINSGTENYYALQAGPVLFLSLTSEHSSSNTTQYAWLQNVLNAANSDASVKWIISLSHKPYQAEQYVGDISTWVRNTAMPLMKSYSKYVMHVGAHHHIYSRGQLKNDPVYNIISGGTAWDQYWNMSTETDFDDVQKTLSQWAYTILEFDVAADKMDAETYSIGSIYGWRDNKLVDEFHRYKNQTAPVTPTLAPISNTITFPSTITCSSFSSSVGELLNSTQFQISQSNTFASLEKDILRDYENLFGSAGSPDSSANLNLGVNLLNLNMTSNYVVNGLHYVRVRHRDRNLNWSNWSPIDSFVVAGSTGGTPQIIANKSIYATGEQINITYSNGPNVPQDWIGIYQVGQTPGGPASTTWSYTSGSAGVRNFTVNTPQEYFAAYFTANGYTEIAPRIYFYVGPTPTVATNSSTYALGAPVIISYSAAPGFSLDVIRVYKMGKVPGIDAPQQFQFTTGAAGTRTFTGLPKGYYFTNYFLKNGNNEPGQRVFFSVGDTITQLTINKSVYNIGEYITATWTDAPGIVKDWFGIYDTLTSPNTGNLAIPYISYTYFGGTAQGTYTIPLNVTPQPTVGIGKYFIVMFTNDSYTEVSNRCYFRIVSTNSAVGIFDGKQMESSVTLYPNPSKDKSFIQSDYPIDKVELLNELGQTVFLSTNTNGSSYTLMHNDLPAGVYYLRVHTRKLYTYKLIVER